MSPRITVREVADVPDAACALLGFLPTDSVVVIGLGPITPAARFDINEGMLDGARQVVDRFMLHGVRQGIVAIFARHSGDLLVEPLEAYLDGRGFDVVDIVVADGERATGRNGRSMPYDLASGLGSRDEFARSRGLDASDGFVVGTEPSVPSAVTHPEV